MSTLLPADGPLPASPQAAWRAFNGGAAPAFSADELLASASAPPLGPLGRSSEYMSHPIFNSHQSEHQLLRYIFKLMSRDLSMVHCMIPLGSCTMKLNATSEMMPITWPKINGIHPFAPAEQATSPRDCARSARRAPERLSEEEAGAPPPPPSAPPSLPGDGVQGDDRLA